MEKKTNQFKAEITEMLDLVVNSLYSKKEIFLRELISNASDAIDRAKFLSLTDKTLAADNPEWKIEILVDKGAKTLMVSDNGTGMDAAELRAIRCRILRGVYGGRPGARRFEEARRRCGFSVGERHGRQLYDRRCRA